MQDDQPTEHPRKSPAKEPSVPSHETKQEPAQEDTMEHLYTPGSLGNTLSWGDQQIPEPVDEIADVQAIAYDRKRKL
jgi:hypothetical protein